MRRIIVYIYCHFKYVHFACELLYAGYFPIIVDVLVQVPVKISRVIHLNIRSIRNEIIEGIALVLFLILIFCVLQKLI